MPQIKRCLFVGLGGTGMRSILNAKKILMETYNEVPPMIGFLGVDTDGGIYDTEIDSRVGKIKLSQSEQMPITVEEDPREFLNTERDHMSWLPEENRSSLRNMTIGAGQIRSNGRFAFTYNYDQLFSKLNSLKTQITNAQDAIDGRYTIMGNGKIEIHVAFSVCGGTGCGSFLDMAYLLRRVFRNARIIGYAVLPEVFDNMTQNQAEKAFIFQNAYGAIKDLDYLMHLDSRPENKLNLDYITYSTVARERPFNSFYFVGNHNDNNDSYPHIHHLAEMISLAMVTSCGELSGNLASVSDNLEIVIGDGSMNVYNKTAWAAGLGVCEILFRGGALREAYATKVEKRLITRLLSNTCAETDSIVDNWIDTVQIRENGGPAHDDVIDYILEPTLKVKLNIINNKQNPAPEVNNYLASSNVIPKADTLTEKVTALTARVNKSLTELIKQQINQECGVGLCLDIIAGIQRQVAIFLKEMNDELSELQKQLPVVKSAIETAQQMLITSSSGVMSVFRGKEIAQNEKQIINKATSYAITSRDILRHQSAITFFNALQGSLLQEYTKINNIAQLLQKVAGECDTKISANSNAGNSSQIFQIDLSVDMLKSVTYDDSQIVISDFIRQLPDKSLYDFNTMTSKELNQLLFNYAYNLPEAKAKQAQTIDKVLDSMTSSEFADLVRKAIKISKPLIQEDAHAMGKRRAAQPANSFYIGVSDMTKTRLCNGTAEDRNTFKSLMSGNASVHFSSIGNTERIIIFHQFGVIPAYFVSGVDQYDEKYKLMPRKFHFDANLYRKMELEEFSIVPKSVDGDTLELWIKGFIFGFIKWDETNQIYVYKNERDGSSLFNHMLSLSRYRNEAYAEFERNVNSIRNQFRNEIKKLRLDQGNQYVEELIEKGKNGYYNPNTGEGCGQIKMDINELQAHGNETILQLVQEEIEYVNQKL